MRHIGRHAQSFIEVFYCLYGHIKCSQSIHEAPKLVMVHIVIYIDDILIMADTEEKASFHLTLTLDLLEILGFLVNYDKSILVPARKMKYLFFQVDSTLITIALSSEKVQKVAFEARNMLASETAAARQLARMVGILSSCIPAVVPAPLHYRSLQQVKNKAVAQGGNNYLTTLTPPARIELGWWCRFPVVNNGKPVGPLNWI